MELSKTDVAPPKQENASTQEPPNSTQEPPNSTNTTQELPNSTQEPILKQEPNSIQEPNSTQEAILKHELISLESHVVETQHTTANGEEVQIKMEHKPVELVSAPACSPSPVNTLVTPPSSSVPTPISLEQTPCSEPASSLSQLTIDKPAVLSPTPSESVTDTPVLQSPNSAVKDILSPKDMLSPTSVTSENPDKEESQTMVTEFLVKWKDKSFVHCEWISEDQIVLQEGFSGKNKIKRFWQRQHSPEELEDPIPIEYTQVDRILASGQVEIDGDGVKTMYLVKWCSLPYTDSTWEFAEDFKDDKKIDDYKKFHIMPSTPIPAPLPSRLWVKMEQSPEYKNNNCLRKYQLEGLNWLIFCWCQGRGSILADEVHLSC